MKKELLAIVFSDLHLNLWAKFNENNERTLNGFRVLSRVKEVCNKYGVPAIFCGDLLHKSESLDQDLMEILVKEFDTTFNKYTNIPDFYMISGNHDIKSVSIIGIKPFSWVSLFDHYYPKVHCIDYKDVTLFPDVIIHGVPYVDHNNGLSQYLKDIKLDPDFKHILLLHTDYPGAKDTDNRVIDSVENLNLNTLNRFDLVLCGHIHKPQRLSKKVYMVGAPQQQRRTDKNCELGYWELYNDLSMKFVPFEDFPKFIDVESQDDVKEDDNYYTVLPKKAELVIDSKHKINKGLSKKSIARRYLKTKGIKDNDKKELLINLLNQSEC